MILAFTDDDDSPPITPTPRRTKKKLGKRNYVSDSKINELSDTSPSKLTSSASEYLPGTSTDGDLTSINSSGGEEDEGYIEY